MELITSLQNPRVKQAARLREQRQRKRQGRIVIDGAREIARALAGGVRMLELFYCDALCASADCRRAIEAARGAGVLLVPVTEGVFAKLAFGQRAEGIVAVAEPPTRRLGDLKLPQDALIAVLEGIEKPGNVGAVLRSADGAGIAAVIVADAASDLFNPNCIRASLGTIFTLQVCAAASGDLRAWLEREKFRVMAARVDGALDYAAADYRGRVALVLGSEAAGLSNEWRDASGVRLPMLGQADSLNVSATAAVLFYEARRQRG